MSNEERLRTMPMECLADLFIKHFPFCNKPWVVDLPEERDLELFDDHDSAFAFVIGWLKSQERERD